MRRSDRDRLSEPYPAEAEPDGRRPDRVLGIETTHLHRLRREIRSDLSFEMPYGIGWWAPHPGTSRRILISDQLCACLDSTGQNLTEAAIHMLEFLDFAERESDHFVDAVKIEGTEITVESPPRNCPLDDVTLKLTDLHIVGVVRALSGALDCLAGVIVGVVALPIGILKADFNRVRGMINGMTYPETEGGQIQAEFGAKLEEFIKGAGPPGWLKWVLGFRNMLVHRGRRTTFSQFIPRTPVLLDPRGRPIPRVRVVRHLPRDPGRSEVQVALSDRTPVLTEDATQTLDGILRSTVSLIHSTSEALLGVWVRRRQRPDSLDQPREQWSKPAPAGNHYFPGYAEGSYRYSPTMFTGHPDMLNRFRAAALDDAARGNWADFD